MLMRIGHAVNLARIHRRAAFLDILPHSDAVPVGIETRRKRIRLVGESSCDPPVRSCFANAQAIPRGPLSPRWYILRRALPRENGGLGDPPYEGGARSVLCAEAERCEQAPQRVGLPAWAAAAARRPGPRSQTDRSPWGDVAMRSDSHRPLLQQFRDGGSPAHLGRGWGLVG